MRLTALLPTAKRNIVYGILQMQLVRTCHCCYDQFAKEPVQIQQAFAKVLFLALHCVIFIVFYENVYMYHHMIYMYLILVGEEAS